MSYTNLLDVEQQLAGAGLILDKPLDLEWKYQRWKVEGEDQERRGWSRLRTWQAPGGDVFIVGVFGIWHGTDDGRMRVELPRRDGKPGAPSLTDAERAAMRAALKETQKRLDEQRKQEAATAARWAAQVWARCKPAPADHDYLKRKQIAPNGARLFESADGLQLPGVDEGNWWRLTQAPGALVIPMHDAHGNVVGIQFVYPKGHPRRVKLERDKEFWPSKMAMGGSFGLIGPLRRDGAMLVTEGFATAASLAQATGMTVCYAFSANNLAKAGTALRKTCPRARLLFCADDDYLTEGNPGVSHAAQACAALHDAEWIKPDFSGGDGEDLRKERKLSDFNDLCILTGSPLVLAAQVFAKLDALKWRGGGGGVGGPPSGGAGAAADGGDSRPAARSVMSLDELVERFYPLDDGTGKYVWDTWTRRPVHRDQMGALLAAGLRGDDVKRHAVWISRGAYYIDQVGFDPSGADADVKLNTWRGWPIRPKAGACERLLETLEYLCSEEPNAREVFTWLLQWLAYPLQHPGAKMASAVILHGPQGTGKSAVFQTYASIFGDYATVLNQRGLEDRFNADWVDSKLFILAAEVVTRAEMWNIKNELKELVTGEWIRINPKNVAAYRQRNHVNIAYLSNEGQPLPLDNDDRRHLVIYTPPPLSSQFYDDLYAEIDAGGAEALYEHLLQLDLDGFHPKKRPPMTDAKRALIDLSLPSEQQFVADLREGETRWPAVPALKTDFYAAYQRWCRENGVKYPREAPHFFRGIERIGWRKEKKRLYRDATYRGETTARSVVVPPPEVLAANGRERKPAEPAMEWLTQCVMEFANAGIDQDQQGRFAR